MNHETLFVSVSFYYYTYYTKNKDYDNNLIHLKYKMSYEYKVSS